MTMPASLASAPVARLARVSLRYGKVAALDDVTLDVPAGRMVGLIGPDGVGKSSLLSLVAGARKIQDGRVEVLDGDMARASHRRAVGPRIAFMAQGLGKNLYPTLSVWENVDFFGRLFGHNRAERKRRITSLLESTGLAPFPDRPAGKLSGGMKQKLSLCCALIHDPDLLILDEPTTGVDPLSRRQFWELIDRIRAERPAMSVMVATAYMEEAARFDWLVAMDAGRVLAVGSPGDLLERTGVATLDDAFIRLLPEEQRRGHQAVIIPPRVKEENEAVAIEAHGLTQRFGDFVAVDHVDLRIERGEIFGFLGSNGCGKTTTMKMLTGLLPATEGQAALLGKPVNASDLDTRRRVGYMTQAFSLYGELTVRQNLELHAKLFHVPAAERASRVSAMIRRFELEAIVDTLPDALPLGQRQRLQLAVALIHKPEMLILDEPTSGVDPVARDAFWRVLIELARRDKVTIFISTHFMNEAERCDRISLMHAGRVLVTDAPAALIKKRGAASLDDAFLAYLEEASAEAAAGKRAAPHPVGEPTVPSSHKPAGPRGFDLRRMFSYAQREALEIRRDPLRATMALVGSVFLLFVFGYGITVDVENLTFAVLDRDGTATSRDYAINLAGSWYFRELHPIANYEDLDRRMRSGKLDLAIEIPPRFGRDIARGSRAEIAAWIDGAMPLRAETVRGYVEAIHADWLATRTARSSAPQPGAKLASIDPKSTAKLATIEVRFRYNPGLKSTVAIVPGTIPLLLVMIPAMLSALSVVREKELGSIVNFYVTPVTRTGFLLGKQMPYVALAFVSFLLMTAITVVVFGVPVKGGFLAVAAATLLYVIATTAIGLFISAFMRSQIAAIFGACILTFLPATMFSGFLYPVSSLQGVGAMIGQLWPGTYHTVAVRGVFNKALDFDGIWPALVPLLIAIPVLLVLGVAFLKKQER